MGVLLLSLSPKLQERGKAAWKLSFQSLFRSCRERQRVIWKWRTRRASEDQHPPPVRRSSFSHTTTEASSQWTPQEHFSVPLSYPPHPHGTTRLASSPTPTCSAPAPRRWALRRHKDHPPPASGSWRPLPDRSPRKHNPSSGSAYFGDKCFRFAGHPPGDHSARSGFVIFEACIWYIRFPGFSAT